MTVHKVNYDFSYIDEPYVSQNTFIGRDPETSELPKYQDIKELLPSPVWEGHEEVLNCYDHTWEIAFRNLRKPVRESGFVSCFIDTAFNNSLFMWDSSFIVLFGKYGRRAFRFQKTLDNFYAKQHKDGFICRELYEDKDGELFHRMDPSATGPNILAWSEWEYYQSTGDITRLSEIFAPLMAFHHWLRLNHTWPDGGYFSTGLGCGMDNQPRLQEGYNVNFSHGHQIWADKCMQQILNAKILIKVSRILGRENETNELKEEIEKLTGLVNQKLWDDKDAFYYDLWKNGELNRCMSIGSYWALLAEIMPDSRKDKFIAHLNSEKEFNRPHRIPSLAATHKDYKDDGEYWRGGVWAPTNYMVLKGLEKAGYEELIYEIACNHVENVTKLHIATGTLWENYAPEYNGPGNPAKSDFVGWTGLSSIAILIEYVMGIRSDILNNRIIWHVHLSELHGVRRYPYGNSVIDLICEKRNPEEPPVIRVYTPVDFTLEIHWRGSVEIRECKSE